MELSKKEVEELNKKILQSKMRLLIKNGFYGLLLERMRFYLEEDCETAYTDGTRVVFGVKFLKRLSDSEVDFIMMHEIGHIVLKHCFRGLEYNPDLFNIACDIVVNSIILKESGGDEKTITVKPYGVSMHKYKTYEGYNYTAEELYSLMVNSSKINNKKLDKYSSIPVASNGNGIDGVVDDHSKWNRGKDSKKNEELEQEIDQAIKNAAKLMKEKQNALGCGNVGLLAELVLAELKEPQLDWKQILNDFIQEEVVDYSFAPPDKRMQDSPFFLPDFNEKDIDVKNILFMIDTSGSMDQETIASCYSEIKGAIEQFDGKLQGWIGFFDAEVFPPQEFSTVESLFDIKPHGGGGTSFIALFNYINNNLDFEPASIIVLTDGYAAFPSEDKANIPVLWVFTTDDNMEPPFGKVTHITV